MVPFSSIKSFLDPSVEFGLQFEPNTPAEELAANERGRTARRRRSAEPTANPGEEPAKPSEGAEVVRLDRFRKK